MNGRDVFALDDLIADDFAAVAHAALAEVFGEILATTACVFAQRREVSLDGYLFRVNDFGSLIALASTGDKRGTFVGRPADLAGAPRPFAKVSA